MTMWSPGWPAGQRVLRSVVGGALGALLGLAPAGEVGRGWAAQLSQVGEYELKAAFVYNFAKFGTWPADAFAGPDAPLTVCVAGGNPFGHALAALDGKPAGQRRLAVREVGLDALAPCHLLFVAQAAVEAFAALAPSLRGRPVLTVGDSDAFTRHGGAVNLFLDDGRVRFEVNLAALEGSTVTLSSQVLRLARIVGGPS